MMGFRGLNDQKFGHRGPDQIHGDPQDCRLVRRDMAMTGTATRAKGLTQDPHHEVQMAGKIGSSTSS